MRGYTNKIKTNLVFDPGGSTSRLRACPFLGGLSALLCREVFNWAPDGNRCWNIFGKWMACDTTFRERSTSKLLTPYVLRSIAVSLQPGYFEEAGKVRRLEAM